MSRIILDISKCTGCKKCEVTCSFYRSGKVDNHISRIKVISLYEIGIDGPVISMRLKNLRDGMEDYEYFAILERFTDKKTVMKIIDTIAPNWWNFSKNPNEFLAARKKIAQQILSFR